ncbi:MAG: iron-containing alcohol dehydrogenase, partial [Chitinophagaceae bacterium]|nr:iron-containing alcohol dehydrogenase [Chitinophagaceae bacterium]
QESKFKMIANAMNLKLRTGKAVVSRLFSLNNEIELPGRLSEIGVQNRHIAKLVDLAVEDFCHPSNPKPVRKKNFKQLYEEAL